MRFTASAPAKARVRGKVKWFSDSKGYGFIGQVRGPDGFVHYTDIKGEGYRTLKQGDLVEFDTVRGSNGPHAANVVVADDDGD